VIPPVEHYRNNPMDCVVSLMAAEIKLIPRFEAGVPGPLFKTEISGVGSDYAVARGFCAGAF
jgi:hypothetical protein